MTDPRKKGPSVTSAKLAPQQQLTVVVTLRDRWGSPIPQMKMTMTQGGVALKAASGDMMTDAAGRVVVDRVTVGVQLEVKLDEKYLPVDDEDRRKTQYVYALEQIVDVVIELETEDDPDNKLAMVDTKRGYVTLIAAVAPFVPVFRFPWKNPFHVEDIDRRLYRTRVDNLRYILVQLFGVAKAEADTLDHTALVEKLIAFFQASQQAVATAAAPPTPSGPTEVGTKPEPAPVVPPPPPSAPPSEPAPPIGGNERSVPIKDITPVTPPAHEPAPAPPAAVPSADMDSAALPRWVWYLLFHHTGLRYSPPTGKPKPNHTTYHGAHSSYVAPAAMLSAMRAREIEASHGKKAPAASSTDISEALVLIERGKAPTNLKGALLSGDVARTNAALRAIFTKMMDAEAARMATFRTTNKIYDGDYVGLGLLKAKRLKSKAILTDDLWKHVVPRTQLRNDVTAQGLEDEVQNPGVIVALLKPADYDSTGWRPRRAQTLDTILGYGVCDQTSETGELIRSRHVGAGIPVNARTASSLQYLTFANAKNVRRGMHFFYTGFGLAGDPNDQQYVSFDTLEGTEIFEANPDPGDPRKKAQLQDLKARTAIPTLSSEDLEALLDPADPDNIAAAAANAKEPKTLKARVVVVPNKAFEGARFIDASLLGNQPVAAAQRRTSLVRCYADAAKGKTLLHVCKWTHQEIVIDVKVSPKRITIYLFSTAGGPSGESGTGLRVYAMDPTTNGRETRHLNVQFGFMYPTTNENIALLDACFLNPALLKP